jgi:ParB/RepB/Spo0J family partition protein
MAKEREVIWIDVDDLGVDAANIRGGKWDYDEELVEDIKNNGILNPLIVRPADPKTGKKYAIVCGSRRYNAAIEAGLTSVPCFVEKMDDVTAIGRTIAENKHRADIPAWMFALKIGEMYEKLDSKTSKPERVKIIEAKTGLASSTIYEYLDVYGLPSEVIELLKKPEERSEKVKELIKGFRVTEPLESLSIQKAAIIARELAEYPLKKMLEVAVFVIDKSVDATRELVRLVKTYPKMSMEGIYEKYIGIPKGARWSFEFSSRIVAALDEACIRKNMDRKTLVVYYVEEGLRRDGFL